MTLCFFRQETRLYITTQNLWESVFLATVCIHFYNNFGLTLVVCSISYFPSLVASIIEPSWTFIEVCLACCVAVITTTRLVRNVMKLLLL